MPLWHRHAVVGQAGRPGDRGRLLGPGHPAGPVAGGRAGPCRYLRLFGPVRPAGRPGRAVRCRLHLPRRAGWLPDLERWAGVVAHFLRPGGVFYLTEIHPVAQAFAEEPGLRLGYPYFPRPEPLASPVQGSYADPTAQVRQPVEYWWAHSTGEIVSAVAGAGLRIKFLHEFPFVEWPVPFLVRHDDDTWRLPPDAGGELPLFFSLRATSS